MAEVIKFALLKGRVRCVVCVEVETFRHHCNIETFTFCLPTVGQKLATKAGQQLVVRSSSSSFRGGALEILGHDIELARGWIVGVKYN